MILIRHVLLYLTVSDTLESLAEVIAHSKSNDDSFTFLRNILVVSINILDN